MIRGNAVWRRAFVRIDGQRITAAGTGRISPRRARVIDARGAFIAPGFVDTHIHGSPAAIFRSEVPHGTTSVVITLSCALLPQICRQAEAIRAYARDRNPGSGPEILGIRIEGPYINPSKCGAQDPAAIRPPDTQELDRLIRRIGPLLRIMTIAPELPGSLPLVRLLRRRGVIASIGHSDATCAEARAGIAAGITHATHLFNAMRGIGRSVPGAAAAVLLDDRVTVELIADMIHVHAARCALAAAVKGQDRLILVTDSIAAARPQGAWKEGGAYWLREGVKAGSCLTMIGAVRNMVTRCGVPLTEAVRMATLAPARLLGVQDRKGSLAPGMDADLVVFDEDFRVQLTVARGKIAYRNGL